MPSKGDTSITSYFQLTDKGKSKAMRNLDMEDTSSSNKDPEGTLLKSQTKANNKRTLSTSSPPPASDRPTKAMAFDNSLPSTEPSTSGDKTLRITYHTGDIFASAPPGTLLIHACNTRGVWGAGIAKAFKTSYPAAYTNHNDFCTKKPHNKSNPVPTGTAQLIPPQASDAQGHWIGCLFTSAGYGKTKDTEKNILMNTGKAMNMLLELVKKAEEGIEDKIGEVKMCMINSGKFGVEWEKTEEVLRGVVVQQGWRGEVGVWAPA
jgi:ADP-ribose 1''-phosphate phosphatase